MTPEGSSVEKDARGARAYVRQRGTRRSVIVADRIADWTIRVGGVFVILAVFGIMAFLVNTVIPLFTGASVGEQRSQQFADAGTRTLETVIDEYNTLALRVLADGRIEVVHIPTGARLEAPSLDLGGGRVSAFASPIGRPEVAVGFEDGTIAFGRVEIEVAVVPADAVPAEATDLGNGHRSDGTSVYAPVPGGQFRRLSVAAELGDPEKVSDTGAAIIALDYRIGGTVERPTQSFATIDADNAVTVGRVTTRINLLTRESRTSVSSTRMPPLPDGKVPGRVLVTDRGDQVYVSDDAGRIVRYDARDANNPVLAETVQAVAPGASVGAIGFVLGGQSLMVGSDTGLVDIYFRVPGGAGSDGYSLVLADPHEPQPAGIVAFAASERSKMFVTADADGGIWLRHRTSGQVLARLEAPEPGTRYANVVMSPRDNGVLAVTEDGRVDFWNVSAPHPETTVASIFGKVWYEGYPGPVHTWQSSSGTDVFEPKLSLVPLIFGTIKGTVYSLLFAVPIALLAAIYTSEFLHVRVRATVKPVMEMMASLPSVVLGFIAALILAPIVETWIAAVLLAFVAVPLSLLFAAACWQALPRDFVLRHGGLPKFVLMFVFLFVGFWLSWALGGWFERAFFGGNLKAWTNGDIGSGVPFMTLLLLPLAVGLTIFATNRLIGDRLRSVMRSMPRPRAGAVDAVRWIGTLVLAFVLAWGVAALLGAAGADPRGGVVDTYAQRNTLVVGFAMGFAVIPIIYTIAEDALNAVPEHLRAASLAAGATPWQTAIKIILPTAMSGVFAAVMIGMGRAVGETMIVVMAAGNTPIMDWNIFNGFRALSANIAVELPEAVRNGTLYRMLFLAALTLFVMTFFVNTIAELIRLRFRKRAASL